jgi:hypothetical protein
MLAVGAGHATYLCTPCPYAVRSCTNWRVVAKNAEFGDRLLMMTLRTFFGRGQGVEVRSEPAGPATSAVGGEHGRVMSGGTATSSPRVALSV